MSKSIWHKLPRQPEEDRLIVVKSKRTGEYLVGNEFEFILDNFTKWAYFDDLLALETELKHTHKALDKGMEHITGLNNMIESWYKLLQSDKDTSTKYAILKSAISAYMENKGGDNE